MSKIKTLENLRQSHQKLAKEVGKVIVGQREILDQLFLALLCRGHIILEGVPGLAKTLIIKTLADVLDLSFSRIQFTPDLMPSDITGTELIREDEHGSREFKFFKGPVFANIVLADEINRTPPKTQSALLESMQEHNVTAAGTTYHLDEPFFVLATQNPIEQEGTYPLPEAQLDRFMFNLKIGYPSFEEEITIVNTTTSGITKAPGKVVSHEDLVSYQDLITQIPVAENVVNYAVGLVRSSRPNEANPPEFISKWVEWGAGPRASQYLILGAKAKAALDGRTTPDISDVTAMVKPVMRHRIITNFNAEAEGISRDNILDQLIEISK